jgi:hypothetical protein
MGGGGEKRGPQSGVGAVGAVDAVCALGAGAAVVAEGVGGVETRPLWRAPEGNAKEVTRISMPRARLQDGIHHGTLEPDRGDAGEPNGGLSAVWGKGIPRGKPYRHPVICGSYAARAREG